MPDTVAAYDAYAVEWADRYESISAADVHRSLLDFMPRGPDLVALDLGAGSGRDAAWLGTLGFTVVAVEPAARMRAEGQRRHPEVPIRWIDDRLPDLNAVHRLGLAFDLILVSAVWMHVSPTARARAFRKIVTLLKPGGVVFISLRAGPDAPDRSMWVTSLGEIEALAREHGVSVLRAASEHDRLGRPDVEWTAVCLRMPDEGAGALPLLRGIILADEKSLTYKLGLLRAVARIADAMPSTAVPHPDEDLVDVPLGLVALNWLRMYLPLVRAGLPQAPKNDGSSGLGFVKDGFRELLALNVGPQDLRIGARFTGAASAALAAALADARRTIVRMPVAYTKLPNSSDRVFGATERTPSVSREALVLDRSYLYEHGTLTIPGHVWRTLQRLGAWVEPVLVSEWSRLIRLYGERMGRPSEVGVAERWLAWADPVRDTQFARAAAAAVLARGGSLRCVWTGTPLGLRSLDIDHCLPWSAWPCSDLWNLLPAARRVNQHLKRERIPSAGALVGARDHILAWWEDVWLKEDHLAQRFRREAEAALPVGEAPSTADVFAGLEWRRLRLRQDQQVGEWSGSVRQDSEA